MVYCMSDIHGDSERFEKMLDVIQFSRSDHLYVIGDVIGDVIDRHPNGVDILFRLMEMKNVTMLLGNHEQMCLDTLGPTSMFGARELWKQNGGSSTHRELIYHRMPDERSRILSFLRHLPDHLDIQVGGKDFHLVHGHPGDDLQTRIWKRPLILPYMEPLLPDKFVVIGHTPTVYYTNNYDEPFHILYGNQLACIDCGCGSDVSMRRLGCLRLDDGQEFYV